MQARHNRIRSCAPHTLKYSSFSTTTTTSSTSSSASAAAASSSSSLPPIHQPYGLIFLLHHHHLLLGDELVVTSFKLIRRSRLNSQPSPRLPASPSPPPPSPARASLVCRGRRRKAVKQQLPEILKSQRNRLILSEFSNQLTFENFHRLNLPLVILVPYRLF